MNQGRVIMVKKGGAKDKNGIGKTLGDRISYYLFLAVFIALFFIVYVGSEIYKKNSYPEMSMVEFLPYQFFIVIVAMMPLMVLLGLFYTDIRFIVRWLTDKKDPLKWNEKVFVMFLPIALLAIIVAYKVLKIYTFNHPEIDYKEWVAIEFFVCTYTAAAVSIGGAFMTVLAGKKILGLKIEPKKLKSEIIFCPKCGEVIEPKSFCGNCGFKPKAV
jgi:hypothetical protein